MPDRSHHESLPDGELMQRIRARDNTAFSEFYRRYGGGLYSMIYHIVGEQREAEDALQDALVQIWKRADTYDAGRSSVFTWAVMIARHRALDRLRAKGRRHKAADILTEEYRHQASADQDTGATAADRQDENARLRAALSNLNPETRTALERAFFSGLTHEEISRELNAPLGTIKARIRRGLLALREALPRP